MIETSGRIVAVVGLGYVGCVSAACLAKLGHRVIGVDRDLHKVNSVNRGASPFYEPGLEELVADGARNGRLSATSSMEEAVREADSALLCVGTPSGSNGDISLEQLRRVCAEIAPLLEGRKEPLTIAIRSTVFPGTCEQVARPALNHHRLARVVSNPEFLREGTAVKDFFEPSLLVVGGDDEEAMRAIAALYDGLPVSACLTTLRTAEMIKYACNAFHAVKIAFANEIGSVAARLGVDGNEVMDVLCRDVKLNVSPAYLRPGFAFGGSCLPKDLRAITYRSVRLDVELPLLESVLPSNQTHLRRAIDAALALGDEPIGVYGLAFKENTDDLRESPVVTLIEQLLAKGRTVRIYDPHLKIEEIYGSNKQFAMASLPHIERLMAADLASLLRDSRRLIVTQRPAAADGEALRASGLPMLDLNRVACA